MSHTVVDGTTVISNLIRFCKGAPKKIEILEAVRKKKSYTQVADEVGADPTYVSNMLNKARPLHLVDGERGYYRQSEVLRTINIRSELRKAAKEKDEGGRFIVKGKKIILRFSDGTEVPGLGLPPAVLLEAREMAKIYPYLYIFENSLRYLITQRLSTRYGKDWWETRVGKDIKDKAAERIQKEGKNRWHGRRGAHPIFYTDIDELRAIIASNASEFETVLPDVKRPIEWITQRIEEISMSRNVVAHNNPLADDDITRVRVYFKDWARQIGSLS